MSLPRTSRARPGGVGSWGMNRKSKTCFGPRQINTWHELEYRKTDTCCGTWPISSPSTALCNTPVCLCNAPIGCHLDYLGVGSYYLQIAARACNDRRQPACRQNEDSADRLSPLRQKSAPDYPYRLPLPEESSLTSHHAEADAEGRRQLSAQGHLQNPSAPGVLPVYIPGMPGPGPPL